MILTRDTLEGIRAGRISLAFRRWHRPSVRTGGTLLTPLGRLSLVSVATIAAADLTDDDAVRAGFADRDALLCRLDERPEDPIYRIEFGNLDPDPRVELRGRVLSEGEREVLRERLRQLDARSPTGPWTARVLQLIKTQPGRRSAMLAKQAGMAQPVFKTNVRKLKNLGLTESLEVGYRLSPRGESLLSKDDVVIRPERPEDVPGIRRVNELAFGQPDEARLVDRLRGSGTEGLSLVAVSDRVVGHLLFTPVTVETNGRTVVGLGLAPMSVLPDRQRAGIGSRLVCHGLDAARARQFPFIVVVGHPAYYPRFGFERASARGLQSEWEGVPDEAFMVLVLDEPAMSGIEGVVRYRAEFSELA